MRVFSVPVSAPFLRTVIAALVDGRLVDGFEARAHPEKLAQATLYLPTRRAGRMAREMFLDELGSEAVLLPRIVALGDIDAGELALAGDLARLMDDMVTRGVGWDALNGLVPDQLDKYWQYSLEFLQIARQAWPAHLQEIQKIEPAARRDLLIEADAKRLTAHHGGPVIAAGSTGSMPGNAKILQPTATLPQGAVVLPGLDTDLDDDAWQMIGGVRDAQGKFTTHPASNHPQFAMHTLLHRLGIKRSDVEIVGRPAAHGRDVLVSETMRPSNATAQW